MKWKIPFFLSVLSIVGGVLIALGFGISEKSFKQRIEDGLSNNTQIQSIADPEIKQATLKKEKDKNWRYYQRYHFHANGNGALALALVIFLFSVSKAPEKLRLTSAYLISIGGFLYPFIWLFAALYGPEIGRHAAKEQFAIFGYMGTVFFVGVFLTMGMILFCPLKKSS